MKLYLIGVFAIFVQSIHGQNSSTPFPMEESSLLWSIEGNGIEKGSYLFGTMHLIEKEYFFFPKKLEKIISKSDKMALELASLPAENEVMQYITLEEGTFFDFFTVEQTDSILAWAYQKMKMTETVFRTSFSKFKPFVILQMATQMQFIGKTESYEMTLMKLAQENEIKILGFETIAEQMSLFDELTKEQQAEMVMESVRSTEDEIAESRKLMEVYESQEIDSLYMMIVEDDGVISEEQNSFLDDRNQKWIPMIENEIKSQATFIAVGAGHLGGPKGLIRLLEEKGYTLSPVKL